MLYVIFIVTIHDFVNWRTDSAAKGAYGKALRNKKTKIFEDQLAGIHGLNHQHLIFYGPTAHEIFKAACFRLRNGEEMEITA